MNKWTLAVMLGLAAASPAYADLRCGNHLITEGDTRAEVVAYCGDPSEIQSTSSILRRAVTWINGRPYTVGDGFIEVPVDIWVYNLGPNKLMRRVRFEDGVVVAIDTLGYGYNEPARPTPPR
jgi:hypothetical protein